MSEGLLTAEGATLTVGESEQEFARAMSANLDDIPAPDKREPEAPKRRGRPPAHDKPRAERRPPAAKASTPSGVALDKQRSEGVKGLVQIGAIFCVTADQRVKGDAFKADALTLTTNADQLANACVETAKANARFGALLDKICVAGPYTALVMVTVGIGAQLARNHGVMAGEMLGAVDPEILLKQLDNDGPAH